MKKIRICLLFGGKSGEHEVSLLSTKSVYEALDKNKYEVSLVGINKKGEWMLQNAESYLLHSSDPKQIQLQHSNKKVTLTETDDETQLVEIENGNKLTSVDVFFPVMHGTYGEDGAMQGFLELMNVAYVGPGVLGAAVGMDKDVMKRLLKEAAVPIVPFFSLKQHEATDEKIKEIIQTLKFPIFVKPANLGSSVGISKATDEKNLQEAIKTAFLYDTKILLEKGVEAREIECAVLGNDEPKASVPGEIIPNHEFYSYEAKYVDENGATLRIPAPLTEEQIQMVQKLAVRTFKTLECSGMARVDFFLTEAGQLYVNEINTIPGFTKISMYPKLWDATGLQYNELLDKLINLAVEKKKQKDALKRSFM